MGVASDTFVPQVRGTKGDLVSITDLYKDEKIVLVFLRHLGCRFCHQLAAELNKIKDQLATAQTSLVAMSLGTTEQAREFVKLTGFQGDLYTELDSSPDARYYAYETFRLGRDRAHFKATYSLAQAKGLIAQEQGFNDKPYFAGSTQEWAGDYAQIGGVFVVGPGNQCDYSFRSEYAGDHPDMNDILEAATGRRGSQEHIFPSTRAWFKRLNADQRADASESPPPTRAASTVQPSETVAAAASKLSQQSREESDKKETTKTGKASSSSPPSSSSNKPTPSNYVAPTLTPPAFTAILVIFACIPLATRARYRRLASKYLHESPAYVLVGVSCLALVFYLWHRSYDVSKSKGAKGGASKAAAAPPVKKSVCPWAVPELYTPRDIDDLVLQHGDVDCNCDGLIESIPVDARAATPRGSLSEDMPIGRERAMSVDPASDLGLTMPVSNTVHDPREETDIVESLPFAKSTACYLREFLAKPHPMVGRPGPVCPFVPSALKMNTIKMAVVRTPPKPNKAHMVSLIREYLHLFTKTEPTVGRKRNYKAFILIFPDIAQHEAPEYIDKVQFELKPEFVEQGLMIGEFHLNNNTHGLHNESFFPLRTPHPVLAIRHMAPTDIVFLDMSQYSPSRRVEFLTSYIEQFENDPKESQKKEVKLARDALADAHAALAKEVDSVSGK